jgi:two-component system NarL family sensor kinase
MKNISITERLILFFVLIGLAAIVTVGGYSYFFSKKALLNRTYDQLISLRIEKKNRVEQFFADRCRDADFIARSEIIADRIDRLNHPESAVNQLKKNDPTLTIDGLVSDPGHYRRLFVVGRSGAWLSLDPGRAANPADSTLSEAGPEEVAAFCRRMDTLPSPAIRDLSRDHPFLLVGSVVTGPRGITEGYIVLEIPVSELNNIMFEHRTDNGLGQTGETYLVGSDRLMRSNSRFRGNAISNIRVESASVIAAFNGQTGTSVVRDYRDIPCLSAYGPLQVAGLNWVILAEIDVMEAMTPVYSIRNSILLISIIMAAGIFVFALLLSLNLTAPLKRLQRASEQITAGDYDVHLAVSSQDEIGSLTGAFNEMAERLKKQSGEIEQERRKRIDSLMDGQEMERQRLARDLHDGLGQSVLSAHIRLEQALKSDPGKSRQILTETQTILKNIIQDIRNISNDLMPGALANFGIEQGLRNLCRETSVNTGVEVAFSTADLPGSLPQNLQIYLFRIAQEAINNIVKHAGASMAWLTLAIGEDTLSLTIRDNGRGFDPGRLSGNGTGLPNIRERAAAFGGSCDIRSAPGTGVTIEISIPLPHDTPN